MYYTMEQLVRKFHRSKSSIRVCLSRYNIRKYTDENRRAYYDVSKLNLKKIEYFLKYRKEYIQNNDKMVK